MSSKDLSTFCSLPQFLSLEVFSSPCRGHSHPFIMFTPGYLIFFEAIINGIVFIYSFSICSLLVYRKPNHFCNIILYPATLLKLFMVSKSFRVEFLDL
jgi:hypothetical protein